MSDEALELELTEAEGDVDHLYYDSKGIPTIGKGCNLRDVRVPPDLCKEITISAHGKAELFRRRIADARADLAHFLPWTASLNEARQRVLVCLIFNMGTGTLIHGNPKMLAALSSGRYKDAHDELLGDKYEADVGERARRYAKILETGVWA